MRPLNWDNIIEPGRDAERAEADTAPTADNGTDALLRIAKALEGIHGDLEAVHIDLMEMTAKFVTLEGTDLADVLDRALLDHRNGDTEGESYVRDVAVSISYLQD